MTSENAKFNLKVFAIDKTNSDFLNKSSAEIIDLIKENHKNKLRSKKINLDLVNDTLTHSLDGDFEFWSYCYNQPKEQFYWKLFLPEKLTENQKFDIVEFSFVLFLKYKSQIYCVIGGSGINVIRKYIDPSFGIDLYQHIAKPKEDIVIELNTRSIASNISQKKHTFNLNQTISETLEYSEIPTKIKLVVREDLKKGIFRKYNLDKDKALMEIGSYFQLRKRIDFLELKELITDIHNIRNNGEYNQLTLFRKIRDEKLIIDLDNDLKDRIVDDIILHDTPDIQKKQQQDIIEVVHPSSLEKFYDCNKFIIKAKFSRGRDDIITNDRTNLYLDSTKHVYKTLDNISDRFAIKGKLFNLNIVGCIDEKEVTYGNFYSHITAEIEHANKKYFRIDAHWYYLEDEFINLMNNDAVEYYTKYHLDENLLNKWPDGKDEDYYNKSHEKKSNYYILDKVIKENIEICDILTIKNDTAYFIHVKNGFNTKMRDLYIQIILSAKRLSNDLKNNKGSSYLSETLKYYNKRNPNYKIDVDSFIDKIKKKELKITFVMAFKNNHHKGKTILDRIRICESNIAKYSLIQIVKEMQTYNFDIKLIDISEL
ncbi:DUF6119 family protein [Flavobacterium psychrophilum]|uniref:DUF6119 family protein n=1 Tax=Flavobacterium psychrophilum TaxID=96345 RepID=UPI000A3A2B6F|nr:DUF6119 family protein [Flavobacterium psychrophilum]OUD25370.1 hypothetical protein FPG92_12415 [Flavobacterium psychrophilum]